MDYYMGEITMFGFSWNPMNFALCNGATMQIQQFSALFALLGTTFGGNGTQNFLLPNLNGRVVVGQNQANPNYQIGHSGGAESVTLAQNQMPLHTHVATTNVTAATTINALTAPTARLLTPAGNFPTAGLTAPISGTQYGVQDYAAPGAGTQATMAPGMASTTATATTTNQPVGGSTPVSVLQPYLAINYVIVTMGIFPTRT